MNKQRQGKYYEALARTHLEKHGLHCLVENYRCRWGEIDLVMRDRQSLVFVEVRFRGRGSYLSGAASVDDKKQRKLIRTALYYLSRHAKNNTVARFDVIAIAANGASSPEIDWIKNAFEAC